MAKSYTYIRVYRESADALKKRVETINQTDLKKMGIKRARIPQIEFTKFLFHNPIFISDNELKNMAKMRRGRLC